MAYIIMKQYDGEMKTLRAKAKAISVEPKFSSIPDSIRMEVEDFLNMYNEYSDKVMTNGENVNYIGSMQSDVFHGLSGTQVKGLKDLRSFGVRVVKEAVTSIKSN